jgi:hypothetical protein
MPFRLRLSARFTRQGWKVKIRDKERLEPPHATILHKTQAWRLGLRDMQFLDIEPDPIEVPVALLKEIESGRDELCQQWDRMYPDNPVTEADDE